MKKINPREIFNSTIFWDSEDIDIEKHKDYIISRVLNFGDEKDLKKLRVIYSDEDIKKIIKNRRDILRKTAYFWAFYFNIPLEEIACLKK